MELYMNICNTGHPAQGTEGVLGAKLSAEVGRARGRVPGRVQGRVRAPWLPCPLVTVRVGGFLGVPLGYYAP